MPPLLIALRALAAFVLVGLWPVAALAQSDPGLYNGQIPTAVQWNSYFAAKADYPVGGVCPPHTLYGNPTGSSAAPICYPASSNTGVGSALKWVNPITLTVTGDAAGTAVFDGSANAGLNLTLGTTGVGAGTYGDATHAPQFTVDAKGRLLAATNVPITGGAGGVSTTGTPSSGQMTKFSGSTTITNAVAGTDYPGFTANTFTGLQTFSAGAVVTPEATPATNEAGYLGAPRNLQNSAYGLALTDAGKFIYHTDGSAYTWTIPANASVAFPIGTTIVLVNENAAGSITLAITSDTLRWTTLTGSRILAANGTATLLKVDSTTWRLTGDGVS